MLNLLVEVKLIIKMMLELLMVNIQKWKILKIKLEEEKPNNNIKKEIHRAFREITKGINEQNKHRENDALVRKR